MKKIKSILALLLCGMLLSMAAAAEEPATFSHDGGTLMAYAGADMLNTPAELDGIPITAVGEKAFFESEIPSAVVNEPVETIGKSAFEGSKIAFVQIAASVHTIGDRAFANCATLTDVIFYDTDMTFGAEAFAGTGKLSFVAPCTYDINELLAMRDAIIAAKGDENFDFAQMHTSLAESMVERDIYGANMVYCDACGFRGSRYLENITIPFTDVNVDSWYYTYVSAAYLLGIINGRTATTFAPNDNMTLGEAAKIAAQLHSALTNTQYDFAQTGENWYDPYVIYCTAQGIVPEGVVFDWNKPATRAEMACLFALADATPYYLNEDVPLTDIPDVDETTPYNAQILELYRRGIATGSNGYYAFYPNANVKRSEAATLIARILSYDMRVSLPKG